MDKTTDDNVPAVAIVYIDAVIKSMRYRKKVRQEVRRELTAHFADALAECGTEQERIAAAENLIKEFGDVKLLGTLLRRAKKRNRPLWRTMVVRTFQAVGVLFLLLLIYVGWFFSGKPVITTNYLEKLNTMVRPVADDSQNAWPFYKQAAEKFVKHEDKDFNFSPRSPKTLTVEQRQIILDTIAKNQESFDLVRQGNQNPHYWQVYGAGEKETTEMILVPTPHLADYRDITRLLCWQVLLKADRGDMAAAFDDALEAYAFGRHLRGQHTTLIEQLVAIAIEAMSMNTMRMIIDEYNPMISHELLASVRDRFEKSLNEGSFIPSLESEKLMLYDELQRSFTQTRIGKSHIYFQHIHQLALFMDSSWHDKKVLMSWLTLFFIHPDREQTLKMGEEFYADMNQLAAQTPASLKKQGIDIDDQIAELSKRNLFLALLAPAVEKVIQTGYRCQTDSFSTLAILAIVQHHKLHGVYPESLEVLGQAGLLNGLPIDPFSDAPLVYRKTEGGFTLYSVGLNFVDDGGVPGTDPQKSKSNPWAETGDAVYWPVQKD